MAALVTNKSGTLLDLLTQCIVAGRATYSNAAFSFRISVPDSNYPQDWKMEVAPTPTAAGVVPVGTLHFTVAAAAEQAAGTEATRIYAQFLNDFALPSAVDASALKSNNVWAITG